MNLSGLEANLKNKYPGLVLDLSSDAKSQAETPPIFWLSFIAVPKGEQGRGIGTKVLDEICDFADQNGQRICLSLADSEWRKTWGTTSQERLRRFYSQFGFVSNRGRKKRYNLSMYCSMYRDPKGLVNEVRKSGSQIYAWVDEDGNIFRTYNHGLDALGILKLPMPDNDDDDGWAEIYKQMYLEGWLRLTTDGDNLYLEGYKINREQKDVVFSYKLTNNFDSVMFIQMKTGKEIRLDESRPPFMGEHSDRGWMDRNGRFIPVKAPFTSHIHYCKVAFNKTYEEMFAEGWVRVDSYVSGETYVIFAHTENPPVSGSQKYALMQMAISVGADEVELDYGKRTITMWSNADAL